MRREADNSGGVQCDASINLVGEIDQDGLDALAELLIAAARRRQQEEHAVGPRAEEEGDELLEAS